VEIPEERAVPANGVYAARARFLVEPETSVELGQSQPEDLHQRGELTKEEHRAVVNIGTRPTFEHGPRTVEAHLLDFRRDIYGWRLSLDFVTRLRPERRFNGVEELVAQISRDVAQARELLHKM
jgi:FAD synthase